MEELFPFANVVTALLIFLVGFGYHWLGQLAQLLHWEPAGYKGIQKNTLSAEAHAYQHALAETDVAIGWIYAIIAIGLFVEAPWGYALAWIPGILFVYHGISYWLWMTSEQKSGHELSTKAFKVEWSLANIGTGLLAIAVAWHATSQ